MVDGFSLIEIETVILFKIKAWLDKKEQKENGKEIDARSIKKHKNDVFRLIAYVSPKSRIELTEEIQHDVIRFIEQIKQDKPDLKKLGIVGTGFDDMLEIIDDLFLGNTKPQTK